MKIMRYFIMTLIAAVSLMAVSCINDTISSSSSDTLTFSRDTVNFDTVFTDLWHDAGDGLPLYRRMKALEVPGPRYFYWIEKTVRAYLLFFELCK